MALTLLVIFLCTGFTVYCSPDRRAAVPTFANGHVEATVTASSIREASGLCASRQHADVLYTHNDSGDTHRIFAISAKTGALLNTITIDGATAHDWEDIACGTCTGGSGNCVYIGDLGGNAGGDANTVFRIHEPGNALNGNGGNIHVHADGTLKFSWDQHNCETLMVDPQGHIYVLSKVGTGGNHPKLVHLPDSAWTAHHRVQVNEGVMLSLTRTFVGGDISPNGHEVLVKDHSHIYYWHVNNGNYYDALKTTPSQVPYHVEPQGEAVAWDKDGSGYYTISEGHHPNIYYYRRTSAPVVG